MKLALLIILSSLALSCTKNTITKDTAGFKTTANPVAIDVRSQAELDSNPAPGAIHIPMSKINDKGSLLPGDKNTPLLVFCEAGGRAQAAKEILDCPRVYAAHFSDCDERDDPQ